MDHKYKITSESVSEGHPDKICDQISDAILDKCLEEDINSRVACETLITGKTIIITGEINTKSKIKNKEEIIKIVKKIIKQIGYNNKNLEYIIRIQKQSSNIYKSVFRKILRAGDQGIIYGYACNNTKELMPAPIVFANNILKKLASYRKKNKDCLLLPDAKSQITLEYINKIPTNIKTIIVSHQHHKNFILIEVINFIKNFIKNNKLLQPFLTSKTKYIINPAGNFIIGGSDADTGLTGRKNMVDTYGGICQHGGGALSGKDPSKIDRSASYMCRYIAKNIVASGITTKCKFCISYAIGMYKPIHLRINAYKNNETLNRKLEMIIKNIFDLTPGGIINLFKLKEPLKHKWCYYDTSIYGHFGKKKFPWEKTNMTKEILKLM